jgi:hypothetical protein
MLAKARLAPRLRGAPEALLRGGKTESALAGNVPIGVRELHVAATMISRSKRLQIQSAATESREVHAFCWHAE